MVFTNGSLWRAYLEETPPFFESLHFTQFNTDKEVNFLETYTFYIKTFPKLQEGLHLGKFMDLWKGWRLRTPDKLREQGAKEKKAPWWGQEPQTFC